MRKLLYILSALLVLSCLSVYAASESKPAASGPSTDRGYDVILLMDSSGSMKKTDPHDYRKTAAKLFISLLGKDERIGVISFGDVAKTLIPLTANTSQNQNSLFKAVEKISSKEFSTQMHDAVKLGFEDLKSSTRKNRILVLMSDGKLTTGSDEKDKAALAELSKMLPELAKANIRLYSIAFTELSDVKLLEEVAKATGGFFRYAKEDKDVHVTFTDMFEKMKSPDSVPLEGEEFSIDKDITEATLVITKKSGTKTTLLDPAKKSYSPANRGSNIKWFESQVFDMITIQNPAQGRWKVKLSTTEGNRIFILTNLSLKSSMNKDFLDKGEKLVVDARLEKDGVLLKGSEILGQVSFYADIITSDGKTAKVELADNGQTGDSQAGDGIYSIGFSFSNVGDYVVKIVSEGKTFKREKSYRLKVNEPSHKDQTKDNATHGDAAHDNASKHDTKHDSKKEHDRSWKPVLIKFGIINAVLAAIFGVAFGVMTILSKKKLARKKKQEVAK
ncbi:MAG: VWA domain-containing protein [Nitrospirae bacterium]|nr:VWA domain-containing protein [Nitrospirota bacterium]